MDLIRIKDISAFKGITLVSSMKTRWLAKMLIKLEKDSMLVSVSDLIQNYAQEMRSDTSGLTPAQGLWACCVAHM